MNVKCKSCGSILEPTPSGDFAICPKAAFGDCESGLLQQNPWTHADYKDSLSRIYDEAAYDRKKRKWVLSRTGEAVLRVSRFSDWRKWRSDGLPPQRTWNVAFFGVNQELWTYRTA